MSNKTSTTQKSGGKTKRDELKINKETIRDLNVSDRHNPKGGANKTSTVFGCNQM